MVLVPRLREVSALYGFTRIDSPEWDILSTDRDPRSCRSPATHLLALRSEERLAPRQAEIISAALAAGEWRGLRSGEWPGRYVLLHTFAHALIREFALECGYSASGIAERIYARSGDAPMAGIMLYTAAPDSEGTLGGLVSLGRRDRLGSLISRRWTRPGCARPTRCAPTMIRETGATCSGQPATRCLFASETSCERGNHYLDRALLVDTVTGAHTGFLH